ncbi:MAG: hypothetical protein RL612_197 [Actinomycetota bacterium]
MLKISRDEAFKSDVQVLDDNELRMLVEDTFGSYHISFQCQDGHSARTSKLATSAVHIR